MPVPPTLPRSRLPALLALRWFPSRWSILVFALPLVVYTFYAIATSTHVYEFEIKGTVDQEVNVGVFFDPGTGFTTTNSAHAVILPSDAPVAAHFPIRADRLRAVRIIPLAGPAGLRITGLSIRTDAKILARPRTVRAFDPAALQPEPPVTMERTNTGVHLAWTEAVPRAGCVLALPAPLSLGVHWFYLAYRALAAAVGWLLLWIVLIEAGRPWRGLASRFGALTGWARRLSPARAIWLVAGAGMVLSTYPVLFFGKSFASVNFKEGTYQLYGHFPTLPGSTDAETETSYGADLGPMAWAHGPYAVVEHRALFRDHEWPLWNRYDQEGVPLLGQGQSMFGDPLHCLVILVGGRAWAWDVKFLLAKWLFAAGVGFLVLAATDCLPAALLLCGSSAFIGFFAYRLNHPAIFSLCYSPWILLCLLRVVRAASWREAMRWALGLILANWFELNSGTAKEAYMLLAGLNGCGALALLIARLPWRVKAARFAGLAGAGIIFCLLATPVLLTFFSTLKHLASGYDNPAAYQLQPGLAIGLFDDIFYRQFDTEETVLDPSLNFFVLVGVLLAMANLHRLRRDRIFAAVALGCVPLAALVFGVVPPGVLRRLPFVANIYHVDNTFSCVLMILLFVLAGYGLRECLTQPPRAWRRGVTGALLLGGALLAAYFGTVQAEQRSDIVFVKADAEIVLSTFFHWYVPALAAAALVLPFVLRQVWRGGSGVAAVALLAGCLLLLHWRMGMQLHTPFHRYTPVLPNRGDRLARSDVVDFLHTDRDGPFRALGIGGNFKYGYGATVDIEGVPGVDALMTNYYLAVDVSGLCINGIWYDNPAFGAQFAARKPLLDLLNVRYLLTTPGQPPPEMPGVTLERHFGVDVYRNANAWPRAFFTDRLAAHAGQEDFAAQVLAGDGKPFASVAAGDAASLPPLAGSLSARLTGRTVAAATGYRLTCNGTSFDIDAPSAGVVVLTETYIDEDIIARLDGRRVPVWRVNNNFRGILVDQPGRYHVSFTYWPKGFTLSLCAAALGLVLCALAVWSFWRSGAAGTTGTPETAGS